MLYLVLVAGESDSVRSAVRCSQKTWDDGDPSPMNDKFWESPHHRDANGNPQPTTMTASEIAAAKLLGHTPETWNHGMTADEAVSKISAAFKGRVVRRAYIKHLEEKVRGAESRAGACMRASIWIGLQCAREHCAARRRLAGVLQVLQGSSMLLLVRRLRVLWHALQSPHPHRRGTNLRRGSPGFAAAWTESQSGQECRSQMTHRRREMQSPKGEIVRLWTALCDVSLSVAERIGRQGFGVNDITTCYSAPHCLRTPKQQLRRRSPQACRLLPSLRRHLLSLTFPAPPPMRP